MGKLANKHWHHMDEKEFNSLKGMLNYGASAYQLHKLTRRAQATVLLVKKADNFSQYRTLTREKLGGGMARRASADKEKEAVRGSNGLVLNRLDEMVRLLQRIADK